jgi:hypothetical protein
VDVNNSAHQAGSFLVEIHLAEAADDRGDGLVVLLTHFDNVVDVVEGESLLLISSVSVAAVIAIPVSVAISVSV